MNWSPPLRTLTADVHVHCLAKCVVVRHKIEDPGQQEVFDECAGILGYEKGLDRTAAEALAHAEVETFVLDSKD